MKIPFFFLCMVLFLVSCTSSSDEVSFELPSAKTSRMAFSNFEDLHTTYSKLCNFTPSEIEEWTLSNNPNYLTISDQVSAYDIYSELYYFLNKDLEFQVNDTIVWYNNNNFYIVSINGDNKEAAANKLNPLSCPIFASLETIPIGESNTIETKGTMNPNTSGPTFQVNFDLNPRYKYKYVYQLYSTRTSFYGITNCQLYFVAKMEYKHSKWKAAGENRSLALAFSGSIYARGSINNTTFTIPSAAADFMRIQKDWRFLLAGIPENISRWEYNLNFKTDQQVVDNPNTRRINSFSF